MDTNKLDQWFYSQERRLGITATSRYDGDSYSTLRFAAGLTPDMPEGVDWDRGWQVMMNSQVWGFLVLNKAGDQLDIHASDRRLVGSWMGGGAHYGAVLQILNGYYMGYGRGRADCKEGARR
jgi:hypothetical protein